MTLAAPNCPGCMERMEPHETFPQWWCASCGIAVAPEDVDMDADGDGF